LGRISLSAKYQPRLSFAVTYFPKQNIELMRCGAQGQFPDFGEDQGCRWASEESPADRRMALCDRNPEPVQSLDFPVIVTEGPVGFESAFEAVDRRIRVL
jgi:hypothetical protein